jgi:hypothetical protein
MKPGATVARVLLAMVGLTMTPAQFDDLRKHRDAEEKKATALYRDGRFAEALATLQALQTELTTKLKDVPQKEQQAAYLHTSVDVLKRSIGELQAVVDAAKKNDGAKLVLALLHPQSLAFPRMKVTDAPVRKVIESLKLELRRRKVKVRVTGGDLASVYAAELVSALQALGLQASTEKGDETLEVALTPKGPVSAHMLGDDVDECALVAVAKWPAGGLPRLDLTMHGFGDEETDGDCLRKRVEDSVALAAEQILRTALKLPLAQNLNKAEGPNGVFK